MIEPIASWVALFYLLATIVLVISALFLRLCRQPARRLLVARATFVALGVSAPLAAAGVSRNASIWNSDRAVESEVARWPGLCMAKQTAAEPIVCTTLPAPTQAPARSTKGSGRAILCAVFVSGLGATTLWLALGAIASARLRARSRPAAEDLQQTLARLVAGRGRVPRLCVYDHISQPIAVGLIRPMIVLPARFLESETSAGIPAAIGHEWGHVRHGDLMMLAFSRLLLPILFAHPIYAWLRSRVRADQELLADACAAGEEKVAYAEALLGWARSASRQNSITILPALGLWERKSQLGERIACLLDRDFEVEPAPPRGWRFAALAITATSLVGLGAIALQASARETRPGVGHPLDCLCCLPPPPPIANPMVCPAEAPSAASSPQGR